MIDIDLPILQPKDIINHLERLYVERVLRETYQEQYGSNGTLGAHIAPYLYIEGRIGVIPEHQERKESYSTSYYLIIYVMNLLTIQIS